MAEQRRPPAETALEESLRDLGRRLAYPTTPDLAAAVQARLAAPTANRPAGLLPRWRRLALAVLAAVLAIVVVLAVSPGARQAVADRIGLPGIEIRNVPVVPNPPSTPTPPPATLRQPAAPPLAAPTAAAIGRLLDIGEQTTLATAQARVDFHTAVPQALGTPDAVYVIQSPPESEVTLIYAPRSGLPSTSTTSVGALLGEFRGTVQAGLFGKLVGPDTQVAPVTVAGHPGYWVTGAPHLFFYQDPNGYVRQESIRLAGNALIWDAGGVTYRLESALDEEGALQVAGSVR